MKQQRLFIGCLGLSLLMGCASQSQMSTPEENNSAPSASEDAASDTAANSVMPTDSQANEAEAQELALLSQLILYFEYDRSVVDTEFLEMLTAHGQRLADDPTISLTIEGHADERGSREYNVGLGENRAQAVRRLLLLQGASPSQLHTTSFGEEQPATSGSNERSWRLNRRVELVYQPVGLLFGQE